MCILPNKIWLADLFGELCLPPPVVLCEVTTLAEPLGVVELVCMPTCGGILRPLSFVMVTLLSHAFSVVLLISVLTFSNELSMTC